MFIMFTNIQARRYVKCRKDVIKKILEDGPPHGGFVIAFVDNWRKCMSLCRDFVSFFGV